MSTSLQYSYLDNSSNLESQPLVMNKHILSKSDFLKFYNCSSYLWFYKNRPELLSSKELDPFAERLIEQGKHVESKVRELFPEGRMIHSYKEEAVADTKKLLEEGCKTIFQASFMHDNRYIMCDILVWNELFQAWDLIEVKSSSSADFSRTNKHHLYDATFQKIVLEASNMKIANVYLIELNKEFVKDGDIDLGKLFVQSEITTEVLENEELIKADMEHAMNIINGSQPTECECKYKGRSKHCEAYAYLYPKTPAYSVYDFTAIGASKRKLEALVDANVIDMNDVNETHDLLPKHKNQWWVHANNEVILEKEMLQEEFDGLVFPIYFLDYETLPLAIPYYEGSYPYQQTVIQYSLHILSEDGNIDHKEYIHRDKTSPQKVIAEKLRNDIGDQGSVIVWNKPFEGKCNSDLAKANPHLSDFLLGVNDRIYDLMEVIKKQKYLHKDFKGKYSIKNVLPVMCPELDYSNLSVSNGAQAVNVYESLIFGNYPPEQKEKAFQELLEYCELDTWAMVRIYQELVKLIA